jgi:hypothetical protein
VVTTTENKTVIVGGKAFEVTVTRHIGRAVYNTPRGEIEADEYITTDWGPKLGITKSYAILPNVTPEESARRRAEQSELAGRIAAGF